MGNIRAPLLLVGALASACVHYEAKPIAPTEPLAAIERRSPDDVRFREFLTAHDAAIPQPPRWNLRSLTLLAFYYHPALDEARAAAAVARGAIVTAGAKPNPTAQPTIGYDATTAPPWMPGFGLLFPIETAGKRGHRVAEATRRGEAAQLQIITTAWQVRVGVRRSVLDLIISRRQEQLLVRQLAVQDSIVQLFQRQLDAGAITPFEATQARLAAATTRLAVNQAAIQRAQAEAALADALGLTPEASTAIVPAVDLGSEMDVQPPEPVIRRQALVSRSDVRAALADYEASQAALQLEIARQYPDIELGPGYLFDQTDHKWTLAAGITLPIFNRNQGPIAEATARREQAAAHLMVVQANALRELSDAEAVLQAARLKLATAENALTSTRQQEQRRQRMYDAGDISRVDLLTAQLETASAEVAVAEARAQVDRATGALEDAIQSPLGFDDAVLTNPRKTDSHPERQQP